MSKNIPISATLSEATRLFNELGVSTPGTTPASGGDNRDPLFHEYMIAKHLESVAKKRAESCLDKLEDSIDEDVTTAPDDPGQHVIDSTKRYTLTCEVRQGRTIIDPEALLVQLALLGVPKNKLDAARVAATKQANPSRAYRVIANGRS